MGMPRAENILAYGMLQKYVQWELKWFNITSHQWDLNL